MSNCRYLQSILCKKLGNTHRNRSSRARDLFQAENESELTWYRIEYCPTPLHNHSKPESVPSFNGRLQERVGQELPNNGATEFSEKMNTAEKPQ